MIHQIRSLYNGLLDCNYLHLAMEIFGALLRRMKILECFTTADLGTIMMQDSRSRLWRLRQVDAHGSLTHVASHEVKHQRVSPKRRNAVTCSLGTFLHTTRTHTQDGHD